MRTNLILAAVAAVAVLAACSEKPQTVGERASADGSAFQGTGKIFAVPGWKQGDKTSWEQQLKTRTQNGQNDYAKVN